MANLETKYLGLTLKNPLIVASSGLTKTPQKIEDCEKAGAGAVVIKSIFEEVLTQDASKIEQSIEAHPEAYDYLLSELELQYGFDEYVDLIKAAKDKVSIPVIASINCTSEHYWPEFAAKIEEAGADALELNVFSVIASRRKDSAEVENMYYNIIKKVKAHTKLPVAMKIGSNFTSLPNLVYNLENRGLDGLVLFNRFTEPDIDINNLDLKTTFTFSRKTDYHQILRWAAILFGETKIDLSTTTGIHTWESAVKLLLAGATTVQLASVLYEKGVEEIHSFNERIEKWMEQHKLNSIEEFRGRLSFKKSHSPQTYLRSQFLDKLRNIE
ncbi:MAG: dihydroorotate dehydrogenase-like protein [Melioribacteraceae bacterium]|nr:dihydroorotate dehydrogenase-like protein [Melioribacteraceae bacterium]